VPCGTGFLITFDFFFLVCGSFIGFIVES
jgi:hypothetical protein